MRKELKPNITVKLVKGRAYHYYRTSSCNNGTMREKYIRINATPGTHEYDRIYWAIRSGKHEPKAIKTTLDTLIKSYRATQKYRSLAASTRRKYAPILDEIGLKNGSKDTTRIKRSELIAVHEKHSNTPRKADWYIQIFSILFKHAIQLEWMTHNPASGIELFGKQREFAPWPDWFQAELAAQATGHALSAFFLGAGTGQRPGDVVKMTWDDFDGEFMSVRQDKTDAKLTIYCPEMLRNYLGTLPRSGKFIFAKNLTQGVGYDAVEREFRKVRTKIAAKRPEAKAFTLHGLRYVAAVELAEAGCSDSEIQSVTGHKSLEMVQKYRSAARQKGLSKQAQTRREQNKTKT